MIRFIEKADLTAYNTFGLKTVANRFFEFTESEEMVVFLQREKLPEKYLILGGGSNLLFKNDYEGLIIYPNIPGVVEEKEDRSFVYLEAGAGVEWDELVRLSVSYELGGLENLSLIPGNVGASPVQNIGAYGVEVKDKIHLVRGVHLETGERVEYFNEECNFGYRDSVFKNELRNKIVVTSVVFKLDKFPEFNLEYANLKDEVERIGEINLQNIRQAVINIRESKLPDPKQIGNAGSFFKNPIVNSKVAGELKVKFEKMPFYPTVDPTKIKLAAGWLIDQCDWKGYREGDVGVHKNQALVLVNYGRASGKDLVSLSKKIKDSVFTKFGIKLQEEVNII